MGAENGINGPPRDPSSDMDKIDSSGRRGLKVVSISDVRSQISEEKARKLAEEKAKLAILGTRLEIREANERIIKLLADEFGLRKDQIIPPDETGEYAIRMTVREFIDLLLGQQKEPPVSAKLEDTPRWTERKSD